MEFLDVTCSAIRPYIVALYRLTYVILAWSSRLFTIYPFRLHPIELPPQTKQLLGRMLCCGAVHYLCTPHSLATNNTAHSFIYTVALIIAIAFQPPALPKVSVLLGALAFGPLATNLWTSGRGSVSRSDTLLFAQVIHIQLAKARARVNDWHCFVVALADTAI